MCIFLVVPGNRHSFLGMPDINTLKTVHIYCNIICTSETDRTKKCSTNTAICQGSRHKQNYMNMMQEADRAKKCYGNTDNISKLDNKDKPMVINKEPNTIIYFLPGPNQINDKRVGAEITQQLQRDFKDVFLEKVALMELIHCR